MAKSICARLGWLHTVHFDPCIFTDRRRGNTTNYRCSIEEHALINMRLMRSFSTVAADTPATPAGVIRENAKVSATIAALCARYLI